MRLIFAKKNAATQTTAGFSFVLCQQKTNEKPALTFNSQDLIGNSPYRLPYKETEIWPP